MGPWNHRRGRVSRPFATVLAALSLALLLPAARGAAGTRLVMETSRLSDGKVLERSILRVEGDRLRMDTGEGKTSVIYLAAREQLWMLDHHERSYIEIDPQTTAGIARGLDRVNREVRTRLEGLPPEQRKAAERLLDQTLGPGKKAERPEIVIVPTGGRETLSGRACRNFEILRDGTRVADICNAEFADVGVTPETLASVRQLAAFLREAVTSLAPSQVREPGLDALDSFDRLDGVPLRVRAYESGAAVRQSLVTDLESRDFPASDFDVPDGYAKKLGLQVRDHFGGP